MVDTDIEKQWKIDRHTVIYNFWNLTGEKITKEILAELKKTWKEYYYDNNTAYGDIEEDDRLEYEGNRSGTV